MYKLCKTEQSAARQRQLEQAPHPVAHGPVEGAAAQYPAHDARANGSAHAPEAV